MPKTTSESVFRHWPVLRDIAEDEWDDIFCHQRERWSEDDDQYIRDWYGRIDTIEIAYALGRAPYNIQSRARTLGLWGTVGRGSTER